MFKELFSRIKSEKSKSQSIPPTKEQIQIEQSIQQQKSQFTIFPPYSLPEIDLVPTIPTIRYAVLQDFTDLTAFILSCPITFHQLPYSNRRVKQISTKQHQKLPQYATYLLQTFSCHLHDPNHFLINDYPQNVGIMPHFDGPAYHPKVFVYSIGTAVINFVNRQNGQQKSLLLEDKSVHIFQDSAYTQYMHGIKDYGVDCVFIKVQNNDVINSSVQNIKQTKIYKQLLKKGLQSIEQLAIGDIEISKIINNEQYTHSIYIPRKRRISITIRHKYQQ